MKKIIVLEPGSSALSITKAIKLLGYDPIILCSLAEYGGDQKKFIQQQCYYEVNAHDIKSIIKCIKENKITNIFGIISLADRFIIPACQVAEELGIKGMDPSLLKINNKAEVIRLIPDKSPPSLIFNPTAIPYEELSKMLIRFGALIIKPAMSAGGKGLFEIKTETDIKAVYRSMEKEQQKQITILEQEWIAQPKIDGTLYSLEGFVTDGCLQIIGLSQRTRIQYTESRNEFPVENKTNPIVYDLIKDAVKALIKTSHFLNGYFHAEFIVNQETSTVFLIDANFGRIGGGGIALQIALSTGKKIEELYAHILRITLFENNVQENDFYPVSKESTLSINYSVQEAARLFEIILPSPLKSYHVQFSDEGSILQPVGYNNRSFIGMLVGKYKEVLEEGAAIKVITNLGVLQPLF